MRNIKKITRAALGIFVLLIFSGCPNSGAIPDDIRETIVYAAGTVTVSNSSIIPGYWRNDIWNELPQIASDKINYVADIVVNNGTVFVCGYSPDSSSNYIPGYWVDGLWNELPLETGYDAGTAQDIYFDGSDLYICGDIRPTNFGIQIAGLWKNGIWNSLPAADGSTDGSLRAMALGIGMIGSDVIVAGMGDDGTAYRSGYWRNGIWSSGEMPEDPIVGIGSYAYSLTISGTDIYVSGTYSDSSNNYNPGYWKNDEWIGLPFHDIYYNPTVKAITVRLE